VSVVLFPSVYNILNMRVVTSFHMVWKFKSTEDVKSNF
jgi:hypothetical protein